MIEIARAFTVTTAPVRLVILDEPTSSLDGHTAEPTVRLPAPLRCEAGISCILISHLLGEIISTSDRVAVMRDGQRRHQPDRRASFRSRSKLVVAMGGAEANMATSQDGEHAPLVRSLE